MLLLVFQLFTSFSFSILSSRTVSVRQLSFSLRLREKCAGETYKRKTSSLSLYSVSQKSSPPPPKTFCNIFIYIDKYISVKFCHFIVSIYPHMLASFGRFNLIFNKMALIFLGVFIVFTVSSFEFQQVRLP